MGIIYCAGTPDVIHWCYFIDLCYKAEESLHLKCNLYNNFSLLKATFYSLMFKGKDILQGSVHVIK